MTTNRQGQRPHIDTVAAGGQWFKVAPPPIPPGITAPDWVWYSYEPGDGRVFVPALLAAPVNEIILCASYDGTPVLFDDEWPDAAFVDARWMMENYPATRATLERRIARIGPR